MKHSFSYVSSGLCLITLQFAENQPLVLLRDILRVRITAVEIQIMVSRVITPCGLEDCCQRFGGTYSSHLQSQSHFCTAERCNMFPRIFGYHASHYVIVNETTKLMKFHSL